MRSIDWQCSACKWEILDVLAGEHDRKRCPKCGKPMEQIWWSRRGQHNAEWGDKDAVVVFRDKDGNVRYPGRNDANCPPNYERVYLRSLRAVENFEREHNVRSEMAWYDRGSGRGFDDTQHGRKIE